MSRSPRPDEIVDLLRRAIRERVLLPGQALNQDDLARRFGVSRIPLREALRTLVGEGLVIMRPGSGAVVTELRAQELQELFDLRLQLEPPLAAAVVGRVSPAELAELERILGEFDALALSDLDSWSTQHYLFHRRLLELAGRPHSLRLLNQVLNLLEPYNRVHVALVGPAHHSRDEHHTLIAAVRAGDRAGVAAVTEASVLGAQARLAAALDAAESDADPLAALLVDR